MDSETIGWQTLDFFFKKLLLGNGKFDKIDPKHIKLVHFIVTLCLFHSLILERLCLNLALETHRILFRLTSGADCNMGGTYRTQRVDSLV